MTVDAELLDIVGDIYDCAIDPALWPQALDRILPRINCHSAGITIVDPIENRISLVISHNIAPEFTQAQLQAAPFNPALTAGWFIDVDQPFTTASYMGEDAYLASRFYREVVAPFGYREAIISILARSARRFGAIAFPRTVEQGTPSPGDMEMAGYLAPHIRRAVTIADLLQSRALNRDMLSATLDMLTIGIILVDKDARIVYENAAAREQLDHGRALRRSQDQLSASDPRASGELRQAIINSAATEPNGLRATGAALPVPGSDGTELALWLLPLDGGLRRELAAPFSAKVAIFVRDLGDSAPFPGELFVRRYGITPSECRLMMMLVQGVSLNDAADALGVALTTVKSHLQSLFAKTGTARQVDLVSLAIRALSPVRPS